MNQFVKGIGGGHGSEFVCRFSAKINVRTWDYQNLFLFFVPSLSRYLFLLPTDTSGYVLSVMQR
jgi:hypothetical protein